MLSRREVLIAGAATAAVTATPAWGQETGAWRMLETEPYPGKQDDISFVSLDEGWYGNGAGKLYHTADGGLTWAKIWDRPGTFIRALGFVDAQNGFLGNVGVGYYPNVSDTHPLYRTRDAGVTWTPVEAPGIEQVAGICGIDIVRERRILQGELVDAVIVHAAGRVGGPAAILRSEDGGETWRVIDLSDQIGMILDVKFFNAREGLVCAASNADIAQATAVMLLTEDGGETWRRTYAPTRPLENCWKMSFPTREVGYATVQSYDQTQAQQRIIKTVDGGRTWEELPLVEDAGARQFGLGFVTPDFGWVGTVNTGFETRDGGRSWAPVQFGRAVNKIRVVRAGTDRWRAYAIGVNVARYDGP